MFKRQGFVLLLMLISIVTQAQLKINFSADKPVNKLKMAEAAISNLYVDTVNESALVESAIRGMLKELDPHSTYATAAEVKAMNEPLQGNFEGIGVQFNIIEDTLLVMQPVVNGPSEKVGIMAGDRIVSVNDTTIAGVKMSRTDIMKRLRGPKGTTVRLGIIRRGVNGVLSFSVKRDKIPLHTINAAYMIRPGVGYIRIESFGATTYREFVEKARMLEKQGMRDMILDLQDNGGGYLQAAVDIADEFLSKGDLIVYTEGRAVRRMEYNAHGGGIMASGKVVVLVNELTASAAEIVSGAIQDQDRGVIVGRRTFAKGLVQRPVDFSDGSMIRLTVAHYYTPAGRCIQKPYRKGEPEEYALDFEKRLKHGELTNRDSIHFNDSLRYYTLREHRTVYGGGGIMPDVFVPLDTLQYTNYHRKLAAKNIIINASLKYIDNERKSLKRKYGSFEQFEKSFEVSQQMIDGIVVEGEKQGVKPKDDDELKRTLKVLRIQLKGLVARDLWDMNEYFRIVNENSDIIKEGLKTLGL
ncbi:S41 family peptidase [Prevotella koreensis]